MFRVKRGLLCLIAAWVVAMGAAYGVSAQSSTPGAGQGLEISPPTVELSVDPGSRHDFKVKVKNITSQTVVVKPSVHDFLARGEDGTPRFLIDEEVNDNPYSLKDWLSKTGDLTLSPNQSRKINVSLRVPKDASPGGHYGLVRFNAVAPGQTKDSNLNLSASIGALVLARVSGDIKPELKLADFYTARGEQRQGFFEFRPIKFVARIENTGNVHLKPQGEIVVKNIFNQTVASLVVNEQGGNVLPSSIRRFEQTLNSKPLFGRYTAELTLGDGNNQTLGEKTSFWVIPYKLVALALVALLAVILLIRGLLVRYERRVLNRAANNTSRD